MRRRIRVHRPGSEAQALAGLILGVVVVWWGVGSGTAWAAPGAASLAAGVAPNDPVVLSFATVGDSREDPATVGLSAQDRQWLQNTPAWARLVREIGAQHPQLLFFNGDMIMGYGKLDPQAPAVTLDPVSGAVVASNGYTQFQAWYAFWRGLVANLFETGTYVVPVPGNHEVQDKGLGKKAQPANEALWRANMGDLILDAKRFPAVVGQPATHFSGDAAEPAIADPAVLDGIATSQRQLTYSFDVGDSHFVVLDTDPVGRDGSVAVQWLAQDLAAAFTRRAQKHLFLFGHKPAFAYQYADDVPPDGFSDATPGGNRDQFWALVNRYGGTYFCGHQHIYHIEQPTLTQGLPAWQVIVGSGGSPFSAGGSKKKAVNTRHPDTDLTYAWAQVSVHRSGRVSMDTFGFNQDFSGTRLLDRIDLSSNTH